ncbi:hypothetical protein M5689_004934 [Euphorbia peplus]|nr:hypothetical protein M5689_004934 [Euphorbia peplus]
MTLLRQVVVSLGGFNKVKPIELRTALILKLREEGFDTSFSLQDVQNICNTEKSRILHEKGIRKRSDKGIPKRKGKKRLLEYAEDATAQQRKRSHRAGKEPLYLDGGKNLALNLDSGKQGALNVDSDNGEDSDNSDNHEDFGRAADC